MVCTLFVMCSLLAGGNHYGGSAAGGADYYGLGAAVGGNDYVDDDGNCVLNVYYLLYRP